MTMAAKGPRPTSPSILGALLASAFIVALGFGIVLPVLPVMVEQAADSTDPTFNARHIGFLTAAYVAAPVAVAFLWGWLSDSIGRRPVLVLGLIGFAITLAASALAPNLFALYTGRILNGGFAAAVVPTALAFIADAEGDDDRRARTFGWVSMASIAGFLLGPMFGGFTAGWVFGSGKAASSLQVFPFLLAAILAFVAAAGVGFVLPGGRSSDCLTKTRKSEISHFVPGEIRLLTLAAVAAAGLGAFEVGLTLPGTSPSLWRPA